MDIKLRGWDEFQRKMEKFPEVAGSELKRAMGESVVTVQKGARDAAPVNIGELRASIATEVRPLGGMEIEGAVGSNLVYAPAVELGARPHWAPFAPILFWVQRKMGLSGRDAHRAAIFIQRKIAAGGTRAQPYLVPALEKSEKKIVEFFNAAMKRAIDRISR